MSKKKMMLFASPYEGYREPITQSFPESEVLYASSLEQAETLFTANKDRIALVIVGSFANVASASEPASIPFVKKVKQESKACVVGISAIPSFAEAFFNAGCDDVCVQQNVVKCAKRLLASMPVE